MTRAMRIYIPPFADILIEKEKRIIIRNNKNLFFYYSETKYSEILVETQLDIYITNRSTIYDFMKNYYMYIYRKLLDTSFDSFLLNKYRRLNGYDIHNRNRLCSVPTQ